MNHPHRLSTLPVLCILGALSARPSALAQDDPCKWPDVSPSLPIAAVGSDVGRPALTSAGHTFLVVTCRDDTVTGVLVSSDGIVLQTFPIASQSCWQVAGLVAAASDGTDFLVVSGPEGFLRANRVTSTGTVLDGPAGLPISTGLNFGVRATFDGERYLVTWTSYQDGSSDVFAAYVTTGGDVSAVIPVVVAMNDQVMPTVACGPGNCLLVYSEGSSLYGTRVARDGAVLDPERISIGTDESGDRVHDVLFDGERYFVVWSQEAGGASHVKGARITVDGDLLDGPPGTGGITIGTSTEGPQYSPQTAFDGVNYWVSWSIPGYPYTGGAYVNAVSTDGQLVFGTALHIAGPPCASCYWWSYPALAFGGGRLLLAWTNVSETNIDVLGKLVGPRPEQVENCWTLAGTNVLRVSASGNVRGHGVHCWLRCRQAAGEALFLEPEGRYRIPAPPEGLACPLGGTVAIPDEVGATRARRRGRLTLKPENGDAIEEAFETCIAADAHVRSYRTSVRLADDGVHLEGSSRLRARYRVPTGYGVQLPVSVRLKLSFAGVLSTSGLPVEPPPLTRRVARYPECTPGLEPKCVVD